MSTDLHILSGAYALDALSEDEQAEFEAHLAECEACREEVAEMQATLGDVGAAFEQAPPTGLKDRVLAQIDQTPQDVPLQPRTSSSEAETSLELDTDARPELTAEASSEASKGSTSEPSEDGPSDLSAYRTEREPGAPDASRDDDVAEPRSGGPVDELAARRSAPPWWNGMLATAAAIVAVLVVGVSLLVANLNQRIDELETATSDMAEMLAAPDARSLAAEGPDGSFARVVLSASRGEAMFLADGMDPAPHEHTYELWVIDDEGAHSAGLFDVDETGRVTQLMSGDMERAAAIGVTVEPEGGSPQPTTDPIMLIELADA
jgi:anti-sigma-K factor RskA